MLKRYYSNVVIFYLSQKNFSTIAQLKACVTYQIIVTPKTVDSVIGISAKTEVTVIAEGINNLI